MTSDQTPIKALLFDVFGTCVDWHSTVTRALSTAATRSLETRTDLDVGVREKANQLCKDGWGDFTHAWRSTYKAFTRELALNPTATFKTVDEHHFDSLLELLTEDGLLAAGNAHGSLFDDGQLRELSLTWHYLDPWTDTPAGIRLFNEKFTTSTLSNGNLALMKDLVKFADMDFKHIMAADMFQAYKPNPKVYLGGAERLGLRPEECCMVAAHLDDLKHAKSNGLRTLFVDRAQEPIPESGVDYVDFWVSREEDGFIAAASKLA